jgi:hypothetical protein
MKKKCSKCGKTRLLKFFNKDSRYRLRVTGWCKSCFADYGRTPKAKKAQKHRWIEYVSIPGNREYERKRSRLKYDPEKAKDSRLRRLGVSLKKFNKTKRCLLCRRSHRLVADHNHRTGLYRGAICHLCNLVLGHIESFPSLLKRLRKYLRRGNGISLR